MYRCRWNAIDSRLVIILNSRLRPLHGRLTLALAITNQHACISPMLHLEIIATSASCIVSSFPKHLLL